MKMSSGFTAMTTCIIVIVFVTRASAPPVLCDTAGCLNGVCLQPPAVPTPFCNCSAGFQTISDPNICEDINECDSIFKCGYTSVYPYIKAKSYPHSGYPPYWPFIPSGRCVNYPGGYYCLCYPPTRPTKRYDYCLSRVPQRRGQSLRHIGRQLRILNELEIIDL